MARMSSIARIAPTNATRALLNHFGKRSHAPSINRCLSRIVNRATFLWSGCASTLAIASSSAAMRFGSRALSSFN